MYQIYCGNQGEALALLAKLKKRRKDWVSFCESVRQLPEFRKLGLEDMLIKPMQRLCRYPLLLSVRPWLPAITRELNAHRS